MIKKIYSRHYSPRPLEKILGGLYSKRLITPIIAGLVFASVVAGFTFVRTNKNNDAKTSSRSFVFQRQLIGKNQYIGEIKGVMKTALATEKDGGKVTITRGKSNLEFMIPIDNPTLNSQDIGILQATDVAFASKDKLISAKYSLVSNGIKEEIILNRIPEKNTLPILMKVNNLQMKLNPDNLPVFYDPSGEYQFHFDRPYVKDGAGNVSYGVNYRFINKDNKKASPFENKNGNDTKQKLLGGNLALPNGQYVLLIDIDSKWLHNPKRVLPITIDPTVIHNTTSEFSGGDFNRSSGDTSENKGSPAVEITPDANTIGLYHFNETSENSCTGSEDACDSSGNSNHGTANGTTIITYDQAVGAAARSFSGSSQDVALANEANFDFERTSTFSIEAWIKTKSTSEQKIVSKLDSSAPNSGYEFWMEGNTGRLSFYLISSWSGNAIQVIGTNAVNDDQWHHVAATYSGSSTAAGVKIYIDGVEETTTTAYNSLTGSILNNIPVYIGSRNHNSFYFNGRIDEVAIFNDVRSAGEILADAARGPAIASSYQEMPADKYTVGLWHMNEASGNVADSSGYGYTGTVTGTTVVAGKAGFGNARSFNGTSDSIATTLDAASEQLFADSTTSWTVEAWFKHSGSAAGDQMIVGRGGGTGTGAVFGLYIDSANDLKTVIRGTQSVLRADAADGRWHYAAVTWDGTNLIGYFDEENPVILTAGTAVIQTYNVSIGSQASATNLFYSGLIDEVRVSNVARTFEDIKASSSRSSYSIYTSDVIDLSRVASWNSMAWTEIGVSTGDGETLKDTTGLLAQWNLNDTSGTTATNNAGSCGATCNGTLGNFASTGSQDAAPLSGWTANDRKWGAGALNFDGTNDFVSMGNNLDPGTGNYSVEYWVKMSQDPATSWRTVQKRGTGGTGTVFGFQISGTGGAFSNTYFIATTGTDLVNLSSTDYGINDGNWHYVAVTFENINATLKLYIDGIYKETGVKTGSPGGKTYSSSRDFALGAAWDDASTQSQLLRGTLDAVRVYNRVLPDLEILSNYNSSSLEVQTRVGESTNPDDGTWEAWSPTTSEAQIEDFDTNTDNYGLDTVYIGDSSTNQTWIKKNNTAATASDTTSTDGRIPLGTAGKGDVTGVLGPNVIKDGSTYKMWYHGSDGTNWRIYYATSSDGLTWTKYDNTVLAASDTTGTNGRIPLGTAGKGDSTNVQYPSVIKDGSTYKMWYGGSDGTSNRIYYATSPDGLTWTKYDNAIEAASDTTGTNGRIPLGNTGRGDDVNAFQPTVIKDNGTYKMWYAGYDGATWRIYNATSSDGLTWTKTDNTIPAASNTTSTNGRIPLGTSGGDTSHAYTPNVIKDGNLYKMWYGMHNGNVRVGYAISTDGLTWSKFNNAAPSASNTTGTYGRVPLGATGGDNTHAFGPSVIKDDGVYKMWYQGSDATNYRIYHASMAPLPLTQNLDTNIKMEGTASQKINNNLSKIDAGTVGLWHLDETGGTSAYIKDSTANANNGTPTGTTVTDGISKKARNFNGSSYVRFGAGAGTPLDIDANAVTMEAWVRPTSFATNNKVIVARGDSGTEGFGIQLTTGGLVNLGAHGGSNYSGTRVLSTGSWYHVAGVINGASSAIYVNGVLDATGTVDVVASNLDLYIGATYDVSTQINFFEGDIDEVRVSKVARTAEEIAESYRMGRGHYVSKTISTTDLSSKSTLPLYIAADRPGTYIQAMVGENEFTNYQPDSDTVGLWHLEEQSASGGTINDSSAYGHAGTLQGTTYEPGVVGLGRSFTGANDINFGDTNMVDSLANLTVDAWLYPTAQTAATHFRAFTEQTVLYVGQYGGQVSFYMGNGSSWVVSDTTGGALPLNEWSHVAWVKSGTNYYIYINGILTKSGTGAPATLGTTANVNYISTYDGTNQPWTGFIDEMRISKVARSADDIRALHEYKSRAHPITVDFAAKLNSGNLIANNSDLTFTVDATAYGLNSMGSKLYPGEKIIVRENYDGTEYIAQGTVSSINESTGATTVLSWNAGSTFPTGGYSVNASVFKWQREYWNITGPMDSNINGASNLTLRILDGNESRTIWLDDLQSGGNYLTTPNGSTITSSIDMRYLQYRVIEHSSNEYVSASLTSATVDYVQNSAPNTPTLDAPTDTATNQSLTPQFKTTATDTDSDNLKYKIEMCTDSGMTTACQTFDQTISQTGWSGQNADTSTTYTSGTQATYTVQTPLNPNTTYYWRSYAIDPAGLNQWSATQSPVHSFSTSQVPSAPILPYAEATTNPTGVTDTTPEFSAVQNDPESDSANYYRIQVNTQSDFLGTSMWDSGKTSMTTTANGMRSPDISYAGTAIPLNGAGTTYYWRIKFWDVNGGEGLYTSAQSFTMNVKPGTPSLDSPTDTASNQSVALSFETTATDTNSDNLKYKIELCTNSAMTLNCQTFDQTVSQTGWSGQNADTNTTYTSGTQATYNIQAPLTPLFTYYWRSYAIDPTGSNTWSDTQATPYSFTTTSTDYPTTCRLEKASDNSSVTIKWSDNSTNEVNYELRKSTDGGAFSLLQTLSPNTISYLDSSVTNGHSYQYQVAAVFNGSQYSEWCTTSNITLGVGMLHLQGIDLK